MDHWLSACGAVPVLDHRRDPDHIAGFHRFDRSTVFLHPSFSGNDKQRLTKGMAMPGRMGAGRKRDGCATNTGRAITLVGGRHHDLTGEAFRRTRRGLVTAFDDLDVLGSGLRPGSGLARFEHVSEDRHG